MNPITTIRYRRKVYACLLGLVILIIGCYFIVKVANPYFPTEPKPISEVKSFQFTDQHGNLIDEYILEDKIALVYFFFTSCQNVCPLMYQSVFSIYEPYAERSDFVVLAHTCDPDRDTVDRLASYADNLNIHNNNWVLLTGNKKQLYEAQRFSYRISDRQNPVDAEYNFLHTQYIAIVKNKKVIQIVDGLKPKEVLEAKEKLKELFENR